MQFTIPSLLLVMLISVGCASHRTTLQVTPLPEREPEDIIAISKPDTIITHSLYQQTLSLSSTHPSVQRGRYTVRLLSIGEDGATRIRVIQTGKELSARPGQFFASTEFGSQGLQLVSASKRTMTASMISTVCE